MNPTSNSQFVDSSAPDLPKGSVSQSFQPLETKTIRIAPVDKQVVTRSEKLALVAICAAVLVVMVENSTINLALPKILEAFHTNSSSLQWVLDAYTMAFSGFMLASGYLGDRFGRKKTLIIGLVGFGVFSVFASIATSIYMLIAAQAIMGFFAALVFPTTLATISNIFDGRDFKQIAFALWAATAGLSVAIGPTSSGWFLENYDWGSVYWINFILAPIALLLAIFFVPETKGELPGRFDFAGFILSIVSITTLVWSIIQASEYGWLSRPIIIGDVLSVILLSLFAFWELRYKYPIFDMRVFKNRYFSGSVLGVAISFFSLFGFVFSVSMLFQVVRGYGPFESGLRELPFAIFMAISCPTAILIGRSLSVGVAVCTGLLFFAEAFYIIHMTQIDASYTSFVWVMFILAMGLGLTQVPATILIMSSLPPEQAGAGSAINDTTRELGGAIGVAIVGSMTNTDFARRLSQLLAPLPIPDDIKHSATKSIINAAEAAKNFPPQVVEKVLYRVKIEYLNSVHYSCWCTVAVSFAGVIICAILLRGVTLKDDFLNKKF